MMGSPATLAVTNWPGFSTCSIRPTICQVLPKTASVSELSRCVSPRTRAQGWSRLPLGALARRNWRECSGIEFRRNHPVCGTGFLASCREGIWPSPVRWESISLAPLRPLSATHPKTGRSALLSSLTDHLGAQTVRDQSSSISKASWNRSTTQSRMETTISISRSRRSSPRSRPKRTNSTRP